MIAAPIAGSGTAEMVFLRCPCEAGHEYFAWTPPGPPCATLVLVHGISRNAAELVARFLPAAREHGVALIAPLFPAARHGQYQQIASQPEDRTADLALLAIVEDAASRLGTQREFRLFGFSGGAQFAHRFAILHPQRVQACIPVSAGWYCWPDAAMEWPLGWRGAPRGPVDVATLANVPFHVIVGSRDTESDESLRRDPLTDSLQGGHRKARARAWFKAMRRAGLNSHGSLTVLPRTRHKFASAERNGLVGTVFTLLGFEGTTA